ncbi:hypothetical protein [Pseudomonas viridiflava]|uniref:hypothetical protein n=1 Tax=Pseudomonas viridiflava TaxID=33069 RepID=UPI0018E635A7|nr:hypothetical protein [Pseudomonas viridiflava]MBI6727389.1 hypothetical protein [Pseudomonas viridiflava]
MRKRTQKYTHSMPVLKFRLLAVVMVLSAALAGAFSIYWIWEHVLPLYGRIYRNAPVVETPYLAFGLFIAPPTMLLGIVACTIAMWTGEKFDPQRNSFLDRFQTLMLYISVKTISYAVPLMIVTTKILLLYRGYSPCPKLLISGSAWQLFWVNDERACFKPTRYINDHWPCTMIGKQEVCIQVDGR